MSDLSKNDLSKNDLSKNVIIEKDECKRIRKHNAIKLPSTLADLNIPKYINYYNECYNNEKKLYREYFKIEKHPYQKKNKTYISSKSNKISIIEKLNQIKKILDELNANDANDALNADDANIVKLPKYISIKNHIVDSNKFYLVYDKKGASRCTLQVLYNKSELLTQSLNNFLETIKNKFGNKID
uniref:Uncharacterized protein n=1 Tax=viral metagenome TaxID=1070528 RepID=A0A6C0KPW1_9ZZZZ